MRDMWLPRTDGAGTALAELINLPSLNIRGMSSGHVGNQAANVIPATATAAIDLRLVKGIGHRQEVDRVIAHIRKQGFYVTTSEPDEATRRTHPNVAWVAVDPSGYDAVRTPMDLPIAQRVVAVVRSVHTPVVLQPTTGEVGRCRRLKTSGRPHHHRAHRQLRQQPAQCQREHQDRSFLGRHRDAGARLMME
jgi:acetylornithine deacetylase/succinyl-diaminopimelate desuccinylase-like protein